MCVGEKIRSGPAASTLGSPNRTTIINKSRETLAFGFHRYRPSRLYRKPEISRFGKVEGL